MSIGPGWLLAMLIAAVASRAELLVAADDEKPQTAEKTAGAPAQPVPAAVPSDPQAAVMSLLTKLSPANMHAVGTMLENDWKNRPEWGDEAVAILKGDGMRPGTGWWKAPVKRFDFRWLRERFDRNGDDAVTLDELPETLADRERIFGRLDRDLDGQLLLLDFDWLNRSVGTGPRAMMSDYMFMRLDTDSNGRISPEELTAFFQAADRDKLGFLTHDDLFAAFDPGIMSRGGGGTGPDEAEIVRMFLNNELGTFESGPELEEEAPDFILPTHDGERNVRLSDHRGKRPVVLIFGSFT